MIIFLLFQVTFMFIISVLKVIYVYSDVDTKYVQKLTT